MMEAETASSMSEFYSINALNYATLNLVTVKTLIPLHYHNFA